MPDETTSNPAPLDTAIPQAPETPISMPSETVIAQAPVEAPVAPVPVLEPIPEPASVGINQLLGASGEASATRIEASLQSPISENINSHLGGNDPIEIAPAESVPSAPAVETTTEAPVAVSETALAETQTPEPASEETTQQTPAEPVTQARAPEITLTTVATTTPTPAQAVATAVAPVVATTIAQSFTKSMRELFTKALNARQNKKRKKLDRILSLFAKQTMITNNEVESLLHVSDSTATRYLATLEKEGKLKQNTKKGQATSYSKI